MAFAMAGTSSLAKDEKFALAGGWGNFQGYNGVAAGATIRIDDRWTANAGVSAGVSEGTMGARAGLRYAW